MDRSSGLVGSEAGLVLISPDYYKINLRFDFKASNKKAEYKALIAGLDLVRELGVEAIEVFSDSMLIVNHVTGVFQAKEERMTKYLGKSKTLLDQFRSHILTRIPRSKNSEVDTLVRLAFGIDADGFISFPIKRLNQSSIEREEQVLCSNKVRTWMDPIIDYLTTSRLSEDQEEAPKIMNTTVRYTLINGKLYRIGHSVPYQRCVWPAEADHLMKEIHNGVCGNHSEGKALSFKCLC